MEIIVNQVATCEILKDNQVVSWSIDREWAEIIKKALESYFGKKEDK